MQKTCSTYGGAKTFSLSPQLFGRSLHFQRQPFMHARIGQKSCGCSMTLLHHASAKGFQAEEDMLRVLWTSTEIHQRVAELGASISQDFAQSQPLLVIGVATGAFMFVADLVRYISLPIQVEFVRIQSYKNKTESSGVAIISADITTDISGKHVLVVEDMIDTGKTIARLVSYLSEKGAASVCVCAFLDKVSRRKVPLQLPVGSRFYRGFECPDDFIVGYGMDFAEVYRNLPYIGVLKPSKYCLDSD